MSSTVPKTTIDNAVKSIGDIPYTKSILDKDVLEEWFNAIEEDLSGGGWNKDLKEIMNNRKIAIQEKLNADNIYLPTANGQSTRTNFVIKYISQTMREELDMRKFFVQAAYYMRASQIHEDIVATNLVQNEASLLALKNFDNHMAIFQFLKKKFAATALLKEPVPRIVLHAGELSLREASLEPMRSRIKTAIDIGGAMRIGHGVSVAWETLTGSLLTKMKKEKIAVEICLTSNALILDVTGQDHPLNMYIEAGVPVTLATDDEGAFHTTLTSEYVRALKEHGLAYEQLKNIAKAGLEYSFLEGESIYGSNGEIKYEVKKLIESEAPIVWADNKAKRFMQALHEKDLAAFEKATLEKYPGK